MLEAKGRVYMAQLPKEDLVECFCAYKNCYDQIQLMIEDSSRMIDEGTFGPAFREFEEDLKYLMQDFNVGSVKCRVLLDGIANLVEVIKTEVVYVEAVDILSALAPLYLLLQEDLNVSFSQGALLKG